MKKHIKLMIASAVLIGISTLIGCDTSPQNSETAIQKTAMSAHINDDDITLNVKTAIQNDERLQKYDISVMTRKGDVLLTGQINDPSLINYANELVLSIEGAHTVHNHLNIQDFI